MAELISVTKHNGVATVIINNPPMNVLSNQVAAELYDVFTQLKEDQAVVSIILTGAGERAFMAGADIKGFPDGREKTEENDRDASIHEVFRFIETIPKPTIALLNGYTLGGGLELALTCDIRIAEDHAKVGLPEVKLGLLPGAGGTQRLPRLVGPSKAKELMFTGDPISAEEALHLGIVNQVVSKGKGMQVANVLAQKLTGRSLEAVSRIKYAVNKGAELPFEEGLKLEEQLFQDVFHTEDAKEGISAFIEKRQPEIRHR
jgi:enoyl-CoA hydratase